MQVEAVLFSMPNFGNREAAFFDIKPVIFGLIIEDCTNFKYLLKNMRKIAVSIVFLLEGGDFMSRKCLAVILAAVVCFSFLTLTVSAYGTSTLDISSATKGSFLSISGTTATCVSEYTDAVSVKSVSVVQTLEKHAYFWTWDTIGDAATKTGSNVKNLSLTSTKTGLASGTYRVKSVFTVELSDGRTQSVDVYSAERKVD